MGTKPTVVSIKKHEALKNELAAVKKQLEARVKEIIELTNRAEGAERQRDQPSFIREELSWFMAECEKSLRHHDPVRGDSYKKMPPDIIMRRIMFENEQLFKALTDRVIHNRNNSMIRGAVNCANYSMMLAFNAAVEEGIYPPF